MGKRNKRRATKRNRPNANNKPDATDHSRDPAKPHQDEASLELPVSDSKMSKVQTPKPCHHTEYNKTRWYKDRTFVLNVLIFLVAVLAAAAAGAAAYYTYRQAQVALLQWKSMEKALDANERAWLLMNAPSPLVLEPDKPIILGITLTNYGKSPAFRIIMDWSWDHIFSITPPPLELKRHGGEPEDPLGPGQSMPVMIKLRSFTTEEIKEIKTGIKPFFLVGDVLYTDPFAKEDRFSRVCWRYDHKGPTWRSCNLQTYR